MLTMTGKLGEREFHLKSNLLNFKVMVELTWYQNNNSSSTGYKKWYVRPVIKNMLGIHEMAQHMAEHNTPFSAGTIEGILTDFSKCIREQLLNGNSVKIDNLAIFKISVKSRGFSNIADIDDKTGQAMAAARVGSAVKRTRMISLATGDMMPEHLEYDVKFGWDTEAKAKIEAVKAEDKENIARLEQLGEEVEKERHADGGGNGADDGAGDAGK